MLYAGAFEAISVSVSKPNYDRMPSGPKRPDQKLTNTHYSTIWSQILLECESALSMLSLVRYVKEKVVGKVCRRLVSIFTKVDAVSVRKELSR